jgi:hypothetical protein
MFLDISIEQWKVSSQGHMFTTGKIDFRSDVAIIQRQSWLYLKAVICDVFILGPQAHRVQTTFILKLFILYTHSCGQIVTHMYTSASVILLVYRPWCLVCVISIHPCVPHVQGHHVYGFLAAVHLYFYYQHTIWLFVLCIIYEVGAFLMENKILRFSKFSYWKAGLLMFFFFSETKTKLNLGSDFIY